MKTLAVLALCAFITAGLLSSTFKHSAPPVLSKECYITCFNTDVMNQFKREANSAFAAMHDVPLPYKHEDPKGEMVHFKTVDGKDGMAYEIKAKKKSNNYLIVIQEWWGLNDYIKRESDRLYDDLGDVNVLALDLYDGKVADNRDSAMKYVQGVNNDRLVNIINGGISYAGNKANIYTIGWCFGGMWSLQSAILAGKQGKGCVMYYGRPETNIEKLKLLNSDVIGFFGSKDKNPTPAMVDEFEANMKAAGKTLQKNMYDAGHGFANPSNPNYNKEATEDASKKTIAYLKERMK